MAVIQTGMGGRGLTRSPLPPVTIGSNRRKMCGGIGRLGQFVGQGATQANCPSGQWNNNLNVCCAPAGTPAVDDPCSIFNQPAYLQTQATAQQQAIAGGAGPLGASILESVAGYDQNIQSDAINCVSNPGLTFTDNTGKSITCPQPYTMDNGIPVSIYTAAQIAAMIAPTGATPTTPDNAPNNILEASAPTKVTVTPAAQINALSNSAAQTNTSSTPSNQQITNATNVTGNSTNSQGGAPAPASDVTVGGVDITAWIEQNWVLLAAGAAALFILPGLMKGR